MLTINFNLNTHISFTNCTIVNSADFQDFFNQGHPYIFFPDDSTKVDDEYMFDDMHIGILEYLEKKYNKVIDDSDFDFDPSGIRILPGDKVEIDVQLFDILFKSGKMLNELNLTLEGHIISLGKTKYFGISKLVMDKML